MQYKSIMKRRNFIYCAGATATGVLSSCTSSAELKTGEVLHNVYDYLRYT